MVNLLILGRFTNEGVCLLRCFGTLMAHLTRKTGIFLPYFKIHLLPFLISLSVVNECAKSVPKKQKRHCLAYAKVPVFQKTPGADSNLRPMD